MKISHIEILGEPVDVTKHAYFWTCLANGQRYMIGRTLEDATEELSKHLSGKAIRRTRLMAKARTSLESYNSELAGLLRKRYADTVKRARKTGRAILTPEEFGMLAERANGKCELTGIAFSAQRDPGTRMAYWAPSIDRIKNDRGYEYDNCRLVCAAVNIALSDFGTVALRRIASGLIQCDVDCI